MSTYSGFSINIIPELSVIIDNDIKKKRRQTLKATSKRSRNAHITLSIVNDRNRGHYSVKRADDERKNIFYYTDDSKKYLKRFQKDIDIDIPIYFKTNGDIEYINSRDIRFN